MRQLAVQKKGFACERVGLDEHGADGHIANHTTQAVCERSAGA